MKSSISRTEDGNRFAAAWVIIAALTATAASYLVRNVDGPASMLLNFLIVSIAGILNLLTAFLFGVQFIYNGKRYFALFGSAFLFRGLCALTIAAAGGNFLPQTNSPAAHLYVSFCFRVLCGLGFAVFVVLSVLNFKKTHAEQHRRPSYRQILAYGFAAAGAWAMVCWLVFERYADAITSTMRSEMPAIFIVIYVALFIYIFAATRLAHKLFLLIWVVIAICVCQYIVAASAPTSYSYQMYISQLLMLAAPSVAILALTWEITRQYQSLALTNTDLVEKVFIDPLTSMYNRRYFETRIPRTGDSMRDAELPFSLLLIDIDFFKQVNDRHGHPFGDTVLQRIGRTIEHCIRQPGDFAVRLGGEEFAVVLPELAEHAALNVSNRIRDAVRMASTDMLPPGARTHGEAITVSIGIATWHPGMLLSIDDMLLRADRALYQAKHKGRDQSILSESDWASTHPGQQNSFSF